MEHETTKKTFLSLPRPRLFFLKDPESITSTGDDPHAF